MSNPYLDRLAKRTSTSHGKESEKRVAKSLGARLQPNSGAMAGAKSDAQLTEDNFRLEMKCTTDGSIRVELGWLIKITHEALQAGQRPALVISFVKSDGKPRTDVNSDWVMMPKAVFEELLG